MAGSVVEGKGKAAAGIEFGIYLPQVALSFGQVLDPALECERLGFDALWLYDHLYSPGQPDKPSLEAWTLATALLARTSRLRVGQLVLRNNFRHPALLAKIAELAEAGFSSFVFFTHDRASTETLELFAGAVMPRFRP
jgi:alkanesulfonate monooxygenase SsuD/methylene tetrahydromethanopterin reductase-like flavin-dependent oxidoreductase (luciferase family)